MLRFFITTGYQSTTKLTIYMHILTVEFSHHFCPQTREHAMLVKTAGVKHLVILINKMDDPTVKWSKERYDYCKDQLTPYLKRVGFNPAKDVHFLPCSGLTGAGIKNPVGSEFPSYT